MALSKNDEDHRAVLPKNTIFQNIFIVSGLLNFPDTYIHAWLVVSTILKNMKVNGKDDIPYMKWTNNPNVPNHQPD